MSQITNKDAVKAIFEGARMPLQDTPSELGKTCVPVMDMTPNFHRIINIIKSEEVIDATSGIIYTTPTNKDFYLTNAILTIIKNATSTSVFSSLNIKVDGVIRGIIFIEETTLTAQSAQIVLNLNFPIKVDRGSDIIIAHGTNVSKIQGSATILGYTVEPN